MDYSYLVVLHFILLVVLSTMVRYIHILCLSYSSKTKTPNLAGIWNDGSCVGDQPDNS